MSFLDSFGVDLKIVLAQFFCFLLFYFVLAKFAIKPLWKVLEDRRNKIVNDLRDAEKAKDEVEKAEISKEAIINNAKKEANQIVEKAKEQALKNKIKIINKAEVEAQEIIEDAKERIKTEKGKMLKDVKNDLSGIIVKALTKITGEKLPKDIEKNMINVDLNKIA